MTSATNKHSNSNLSREKQMAEDLSQLLKSYGYHSYMFIAVKQETSDKSGTLASSMLLGGKLDDKLCDTPEKVVLHTVKEDMEKIVDGMGDAMRGAGIGSTREVGRHNW